MNDLTVCTTLTMSSREIAELTGKSHKHVLRDIGVMLEGLGLAEAQFWATALIDGPNGSKRNIKVFNLPKRETLILVSGYDVMMRARIIDRWQELEGQLRQPQFHIPKTYAEALRLSADLSDQNAKMAELIEENRPKVEFHDAVSQTEQMVTVSEAAKILGTGEKRLFKLLRDRGYILRNSTAPAQRYVNMGLFSYKITTFECPSGTVTMHTQPLVTGKGIAYLQRNYFRAQGVQQEFRFQPNPPGTIKSGSVSDKILSLLRAHIGRNFSESDIVKEIGEKSRGSVSFALQKLRFYGFIESIPSPVNARYFMWRIKNQSI